MNFNDLHKQDNPLLICNVWDVASAQTAKKLGFQAIATSSSAVAAMLGYHDGEDMAFSELAYIVGRIVANTELPVSVDLEGGYSRDAYGIAQNIKTLSELGVVGINLEDSVLKTEREILPAQAFADTLKEVKTILKKEGVEMFINLRTDPFLLGLENPVEESLQRIKLYEEAGADGIFTPCIIKADDIKTITTSTDLPINVMCMPDLPGFEELKALGVKRISMGSFIQGKLTRSYEQMLETVVTQGSFSSVFV